MRDMRLPFFFAFLAPFLLLADVALVAPQDGATVPLLTDAQKAYLDLPLAERRVKFADRVYREKVMGRPAETVGGVARATYWPKTVRLAWTPVTACRVRVVNGRSGRVVFDGDVTGGELILDNLEIACPYAWTVTDADGSVTRGFMTEDRAPRLIADPHVPNVRDLGGRMTSSGRRVRQGLVFRSAGLNDNARSAKSSPEELAKADPSGALAALRPSLAARAASWRSTKPADLSLTSVSMPVAWRRTKLPNGLSHLKAAAVFAAREWAGEAETLAAEDGVVALGSVGEGQWSVLEATFVSQTDGYAVLGVSADWFWALAVNGEIVRDLLDGNRRAPRDAPHLVCVPVKKGDNALTAIVGSGSQGYLFRLVPGEATSKDALVGAERQASAQLPELLQSHSPGFRVGPTRIHDDNRDFWLKTLGIKSDIDLRSDEECYGMTGSPLGESVRWFHISSSSYRGIFNRWGSRSFAEVFRVFLDEANYPIVFHCIAGQDRTGAVALILNALLGVNENELYLDWEATGFRNRNPSFNHENLFDVMVAGFRRQFPAETLQESIRLYVLSLGFTEADIGKLRDLLLE